MGAIQNEDGYVRSVAVAVALSVGGLVAAQIVTLPAFLLDTTLLESPGDATREATVVLFVLNFLAFVLVGGLYLWLTDRGWAYVDVRMPTPRGWAYVLVGIVASIGFVMLVNVVVTIADLPSSDSDVVQFIGDDPTMALIMIAIVFVFNAPAEEFLFRNVIQKRLYAAFTRMGAVLATSTIFAIVHLPAYALAADGTFEAPAAIVVSLAVVFGGAVIFGVLYARTDNLAVPTAAHATFNAFQFGLLYLVLRFGDPEEIEAATSTVLETTAGLVPL